MPSVERPDKGCFPQRAKTHLPKVPIKNKKLNGPWVHLTEKINKF